jgi:hypothetical protein
VEQIVNEFLEQLDTSPVTDNWRLSRWNIWQKQGNKKKGKTGENLIEHYLEAKKYENNHAGGASLDFDLQFNEHNIEVKTSFALKTKGEIIHDNFKWQHIGMHKNWEYIVFIGINPEVPLGRVRRGWRADPKELNVLWFTKEQISTFCEQGLMTPQQGGLNGGNDDWWTTTPFFKTINYGKDYENIPISK